MLLPRKIPFQQIGDATVGYISVAQQLEVVTEVDFTIRRVYWIYDTPVDVERGNHALIKTHQVLVAVAGKVTIELENTRAEKFSYTLEHPGEGLFVPAGYWKVIRFSPGSVLLSLSSREYDASDYIRDYESFKKHR